MQSIAQMKTEEKHYWLEKKKCTQYCNLNIVLGSRSRLEIDYETLQNTHTLLDEKFTETNQILDTSRVHGLKPGSVSKFVWGIQLA
jgi:hypothetical protein